MNENTVGLMEVSFNKSRCGELYNNVHKVTCLQQKGKTLHSTLFMKTSLHLLPNF